MKHILFAVLIVLSLATAGWAGEPLAPSVETAECSERNNFCGLTWAQNEQAKTDCLARMEAAMRAIEPWIGMDLKRTQNGGWMFTYPVEPDEKKREALQLWADAKRCWGKP